MDEEFIVGLLDDASAPAKAATYGLLELMAALRQAGTIDRDVIDRVEQIMHHALGPGEDHDAFAGVREHISRSFDRLRAI